MSTKGEVLRHPVNGSPEQTWDGFSWPAFFFGAIWLLAKGLYGHFVIMLLLCLVTYGVAVPIIAIVYGFIGNGVYKGSLLKKGYLTESQSNTRKCPFCAEMIKSEAKVCRYCGKEVPAIKVDATTPVAAEPSGFGPSGERLG